MKPFDNTLSDLGYIQSIEEFCEDQKEGYRIVTDKTVSVLLIDNEQICCEDWGYFSSPDDLQSYIGKKLLRVEAIDQDYDCKETGEHFQSIDIHFVRFHCERDSFDIAVYNQDYGHYGHSVVFKQYRVGNESDVIEEDNLTL